MQGLKATCRNHNFRVRGLDILDGIAAKKCQKFDCWSVYHSQVAFSRCAGTAAATRWARPTARAPSSYSTSESEKRTWSKKTAAWFNGKTLTHITQSHCQLALAYTG